MGEKISKKNAESTIVETLHTVSQNFLNHTPKICLVDTMPDVHKLLTEKLYDCTSATLGAYVDTPKSRSGMQSYIRPMVSLPSNLHEFQVVVVDLAMDDKVDGTEAIADLKNVSGKAAYALLSSYPEQVFNSKGFGARRFSIEVKEMLKSESIIVAFAANNNSVHYDVVEIGANGNSVIDQFQYETLQLCDGVVKSKNKHGKKLALAEASTRFHSVLGKYLDNSHYEVVFTHPTIWKDRKYELDGNFLPLLVNEVGEVIGYANVVGKGWLFMLPQLKNKAEFLVEFFDALAEVFPTLFPYNGMFAWLDDGTYPLPGEEELHKQRSFIEQKYAADITENEAAIANLKEEFSFLRVMISGTGDELVEAVNQYFIWLGFTSAKTMDEHSLDVLEEDIQVEMETGLLIVEVKGIGGTSKDKECSQISKIKHRRMEERQAFDVSALYVVNHQRYMSPKARSNPPFTSNQIKDAQLDKRGLVTTYQLYNAYFDVVSGLIDKADVRSQLLKFGLVKISPPDLVDIGVADEMFQQGSILILKLTNQKISVGMKVYACKNDVYVSRKIIGIQVDDVKVEEVENGEVGIRLDEGVKKGSRIYIAGAV